jgi:hypothetical protein
MGEILGLGLSHYPGPVTPSQYWTRMLERNVEVGRIAPELFADKSRWPAEMIRELGSDNGASAAVRHRDQLLAGYRTLQTALEAFDPDLVVIWGDDQFENFKRDCIPAFCVGIFDSVTTRPYNGSAPVFKTDENVWGLPPDTVLEMRGHKAAASGLARNLLTSGFDIAYALTVRHPAGLAHSFNNTVLYLDFERHGSGFKYPIVPFHVNCYGDELMRTSAIMVGEGSAELSPPAPSPQRCFAIGAATARYFAASPWRVALIGSSSWSHGSLTQKHGRLYPDVAADNKRLEELRDGRFRSWGNLTSAELGDAGQHEMLNWICLAGAMSELDRSVEIVDFVESYIFNSSKCFALFPPTKKAA